jgi:NAD(P)-dependent dehydrogenase (short-subunit alcohol dehydrogenase family)
MSVLGAAAALRFDDRAVLVTGAGRGIGRAHAELLARRGARVMVADVGTDLYGTGSDATPALDTVAAIRRAGGTAEPFLADLSEPEGARAAVDATIAAFGRIDGLVHNAGFTLGGREFADDDLDRLDALLAVNARAGFELVRRAWPTMLAAGYGRIVLTSSTALFGMARSVAYTTAKGALLGLTRALADEGREHGITVNALAPAGATRMAENLADSPYRSWFLRTMRPELVSPAVAVLLHDSCTTTGELIVAAGGRVAAMRMAETRGFVDPELTPESLHEHWDEVLHPSGAAYPRNTAESGEFAARLLGSELSEPVSVVAGTTSPAHQPSGSAR